MKYLKVKKATSMHASDRLYTRKEVERVKARFKKYRMLVDAYFLQELVDNYEIVNISRKKIYSVFGARFSEESSVN